MPYYRTWRARVRMAWSGRTLAGENESSVCSDQRGHGLRAEQDERPARRQRGALRRVEARGPRLEQRHVPRLQPQRVSGLAPLANRAVRQELHHLARWSTASPHSTPTLWTAVCSPGNRLWGSSTSMPRAWSVTAACSFSCSSRRVCRWLWWYTSLHAIPRSCPPSWVPAKVARLRSHSRGPSRPHLSLTVELELSHGGAVAV